VAACRDSDAHAPRHALIGPSCNARVMVSVEALNPTKCCIGPSRSLATDLYSPVLRSRMAPPSLRGA